MDDFSEKRLFNAGNCFAAQTVPNILENGPINPDIGGFIVGLASIIINVLLPILLRWKRDDIQGSIFMLLLQVYPILILTMASIHSGAFSLFDAHFAIAVISSPSTVYFVYSSFLAAINRDNDLFKNIHRSKKLMIAFGVLLPAVWITLHVIISFDGNAFRNSKYCSDTNILDWLVFLTISNFVGVLNVMGRRDLFSDIKGRGGLGVLSLLVLWMWGFYLIRHLDDIVQEYIERKNSCRVSCSRPKRFPCLLWQIFATPWDVITTSHPWTVFFIVLGLHWSWVLGIVKGLSLRNTNVTYGQVLSLFSVVPPLVQVVKLISLRYVDLWIYVKELPSSFLDGVRFCLHGEPNPWKLKKYGTVSPSPPVTTYRRWIIVIIFMLSATGTESIWIMNYVAAGTIPTRRTHVNDPHSAWKPFSISLYAYGYLVCVVSMWVWTSYFDFISPFTKPSLPNDAQEREKCVVKSYIWRAIVYFIHLIIVLPIAMLFCFGPLFAPFAALPLSQQHQWEHFCDKFPGEVILTGLSYKFQPSIASFYFIPPEGSSMKQLIYRYFLSQNINGSSTIRNFTFGEANPYYDIRDDILPSTKNVVLNLNNNTISGQCIDPNSGLSASPKSPETISEPCMEGNFTSKGFLRFTINDTKEGSVTRLRAQDLQWMYSTDAPSFILRYVEDDNTLGSTVIQTAVTKRNFCDTLKVCVSSGMAAGPEVIAPLGLALIMQDRYADFCMQPMVYTN